MSDGLVDTLGRIEQKVDEIIKVSKALEEIKDQRIIFLEGEVERLEREKLGDFSG